MGRVNESSGSRLSKNRTREVGVIGEVRIAGMKETRRKAIRNLAVFVLSQFVLGLQGAGFGFGGWFGSLVESRDRAA